MEHLSEGGGTPEVKPSPKKETGSSTSNGSSGGGGGKIKSSKETNQPSGEAYDNRGRGLAEISSHLYYKTIAYFIGASLSKTHTSVTALLTRVYLCLYVCLDRPLTVNFK